VTSWETKTGMKIIGSGIDITILKLVGATLVTGDNHKAVGSQSVTGAHLTDFCEVSNFTVDCNMDGQPQTQDYDYAHVACGAVMLSGSHVRIRRVKAIHFGTKAIDVECFVIGLMLAHPEYPEAVDSGIEDCIAIQPCQQNIRETTVMHVIGGSDSVGGFLQRYSRAPFIRNCYVDCAFQNSVWAFPNNESLRFTVTEHPPGSGTWWGTFTGKHKHGRTMGQWVRLHVTGTVGLEWDGYFQIVDTPSDYALSVALLSSTPPNQPAQWSTWCGVFFQALAVALCRSAIVEGNRVYNAFIGGPYQDFYNIREVIIRNNYYRNVVIGVYFYMGGESAVVRLIELTHIGTTATATTPFPHLLIVGDRVHISGAGPNEYNGIFEITTMPVDIHGDPITNKFTYTTVYPPTGDGGSSVDMQRVWGLDRLVVENNVIELSADLLDSGDYGATNGAVDLVDRGLIPVPPPYVHGDVIVKNNHVRHVDGLMNPSFASPAITIYSANRVIAEDNVVDLVMANPLRTARCGSVHFLNNRNSAGVLIPGYNLDTSRHYDELETAIADAFILAF
jgi:hypothetical protein